MEKSERTKLIMLIKRDDSIIKDLQAKFVVEDERIKEHQDDINQLRNLYPEYFAEAE